MDQARQVLRQIRKFTLTTRRVIKESIDWFFNNILFDTTVSSGRFRRWLFIFLAGAFWGVTAFANNPPTAESDFFIYPLETLFHAKILRHVLVIAITFWLSLKVSAIYLDDVFELENPEIAERYILQASLANKYPQIEIKDGQVKHAEDSTIVRIGGPGLVRVHYDSAALFEKHHGDPTVIIAEDELVALDRFERLRKTIRLRDHIEETDITTRTRDGIPVSAKGVRIKYYLQRYADLATTGKVPFPVVREGVEKQVYRESVHNRLDPLNAGQRMDDEAPETKGKHPETLDLSPSPITAELRSFINNATLSEFLAAISDPEVNQLLEDSQQLERDALSLSGEVPVPDGNGSQAQEAKPAPEFQHRAAITKQIYENFRKGARLTSGLELEWIDIGTWVLPDKAEQIVKQHEEAWRKSLVNLKSRSDSALAGTEQESRIKTTRSLLRELIFEFNGMADNASEQEIIHTLLNQYMQKLGLALDIYQKRAESKPKPLTITKIHHINLADAQDDERESMSPLQLTKAFAHLSALLKHTRKP